MWSEPGRGASSATLYPGQLRRVSLRAGPLGLEVWDSELKAWCPKREIGVARQRRTVMRLSKRDQGGCDYEKMVGNVGLIF